MTDTAQRLLRLLHLLQARPVWSGEELADRLEVTTRSVRRDIERLRGLGYPVRSSQGHGGGYQLGPGASLPPLLLDDDEAVAVAVSLHFAARNAVAGVEEAAVRALATLDQVTPAPLRRRILDITSTTSLLEDPAVPVDGRLLLTLARAIRSTLRVTLEYTARDGARSARRVEPYRLVTARRRWYLMAWDLDRDDWRTFRLDRMESAEVGTWSFTARPHPDPVDYVHRSISLSPYRVLGRIRVLAPVDEVRARIAPLQGVATEEGDGTTLLEIGGDDGDWIARELAVLGLPFEVLAPTELRDAVRRLAGELLRGAEAGAPGRTDPTTESHVV
jgi:predicted DNA-binding transcriptional regulator YafY